VARRPDTGSALDLQVDAGVDAASVVGGQVGRGEDRVGLDARGPDDGVGVELGAVGEHDVPVDAGLEHRLQPDVDAATPQLADGVLPEIRADLRQDPAGRV